MMTETLRPKGSIAHCLIESVYERNGSFYLIDDVGNRIKIPLYEFNRLISEGVPINENYIKKTNSN